MSTKQIIQADWTYIDSRFVENACVAVDASGTIQSVGTTNLQVTKRLPGRILLPGMVNAHSHAFQRAIRGKAQRFPKEAGSFWSWREAMYALVDSIDTDRFYEISRSCFADMLHAGITSVGEFHYVHHDATGRGWAFDEAILAAAGDAGIRIRLLNTFYKTGGINQPLSGGQRRFACEDAAEFIEHTKRLGARCDGATQSVGIAAHSIRAVPLDNLTALHAAARDLGWVMHMHIEEQPKEIEECIAAYGTNPLALLNDRLQPGPELTAIHCTHSTPADLRRFIDGGSHICICPITEADLGDGIADVPAMIFDETGSPASRRPICLGTDSNIRIDMLEEQRWLEYVQRLKGERRGVCLDDAGQVAANLFCAATECGAASLGLEAGAIAPGRLADFFAVAVEPALDGDPDHLLPRILFSAGREAVRDVCVGGKWIA